MPYTSATARRYHNHVTPAVARRVWAAVTRQPCATVVALAADANTTFSIAGAALRLLRDAGYVDFSPKSVRARRVIVPFYVGTMRIIGKDEEQCSS